MYIFSSPSFQIWCYLINFYLSQYGEEDPAFEIHKINFISTLAVVVINTKHNLTIGIKDSATFAI